MSPVPQRFSEERAADDARAESVKPLLAFFIDQYNWLVEGRLQKLVFYAEAVHYRDYEERLTDVDWRAFMYGMFSEDVRTALEELPEDGCETKRTIHNRKRTVAYLEPPEGYDVPPDLYEFLTGVHEETQHIDTTDLIAWTKDHPLFSATAYDDTVDFTDHP